MIDTAHYVTCQCGWDDHGELIQEHTPAATGMSQEKAAAGLDVTLRTLQRWEDGETEPKASQLASLTAAYGITITDLFDDAQAAA